MKGDNIRYLIVIILLVTTIVFAGCVSENNKTVVNPTLTPAPTTISLITSLSVTEKKAMIEKRIAEEPVIPTVVYKKAGSEVNRKALDKLSGFFLATDKTATYDNLFSDMLVFGPGLWQNIKDDPEMRRITTGVIQLRIPNQEEVQTLEGKIFQRKVEVESFQRAF